MADISAEITAFRNAVYGEDVRDAMVSLANKLNDVATQAVNDVNTATNDWFQNIKLNIDTLVDGSPLTVEPELTNGFVYYQTGVVSNTESDYYRRTNYIPIPQRCSKIVHNFTFSSNDGYAFYDANKLFISGGQILDEITTIPSNACFIIFSSYSSTKNHTGKSIVFYVNYKIPTEDDIELYISDIIENDEFSPILVGGFINYSTYAISNNSYSGKYNRTELIHIPYGTVSINHNFYMRDSAGYAFYNDALEGIGGGNDAETISSIPEGSKYFSITDYNVNGTHSGKKLKFNTNYKTLKELENYSDYSCNINNLVTYGDSHVARGLWQTNVINYFNIDNHTNLGIGSSTVAENASAEQPSFVNSDRIQSIKTANPDTIIIIGGTNDVHLDTSLGTNSELTTTIANKDKTTFYGAYSYLIETLLTWKPGLQIILCTPPQGTYDQSHTVKYGDIAKVVIEIAEFYSIPVADIFGKAGINKINLAMFSDDSIHYNSIGNVRVSDLIIATIKDNYIGFKHS